MSDAVTFLNELLEVVTFVSVELRINVVPKMLSIFATAALSVDDA